MASQKSPGNTSRRTLAHCAHFTSAAPQSEMEKCAVEKARRRSAARTRAAAAASPRDRTRAHRAFNSSDSANTSRGTAKRKTGRNAHMRYAARATSSAALAPRPSKRASRQMSPPRVAWKVSGPASSASTSICRRQTRNRNPRHSSRSRGVPARSPETCRRRPRPRPSRAPTPTRAAPASAAASESVVRSLRKSGAGELPADPPDSEGGSARGGARISAAVTRSRSANATRRFTPCTSPRVAHGDPLRSSRRAVPRRATQDASSRTRGPRPPEAPPTPRLFLSGPKPEDP